MHNLSSKDCSSSSYKPAARVAHIWDLNHAKKGKGRENMSYTNVATICRLPDKTKMQKKKRKEKNKVTGVARIGV